MKQNRHTSIYTNHKHLATRRNTRAKTFLAIDFAKPKSTTLYSDDSRLVALVKQADDAALQEFKELLEQFPTLTQNHKVTMRVGSGCRKGTREVTLLELLVSQSGLKTTKTPKRGDQPTYPGARDRQTIHEAMIEALLISSLSPTHTCCAFMREAHSRPDHLTVVTDAVLTVKQVKKSTYLTSMLTHFQKEQKALSATMVALYQLVNSIKGANPVQTLKATPLSTTNAGRVMQLLAKESKEMQGALSRTDYLKETILDFVLNGVVLPILKAAENAYHTQQQALIATATEEFEKIRQLTILLMSNSGLKPAEADELIKDIDTEVLKEDAGLQETYQQVIRPILAQFGTPKIQDAPGTYGDHFLSVTDYTHQNPLYDDSAHNTVGANDLYGDISLTAPSTTTQDHRPTGLYDSTLPAVVVVQDVHHYESADLPQSETVKTAPINLQKQTTKAGVTYTDLCDSFPAKLTVPLCHFVHGLPTNIGKQNMATKIAKIDPTSNAFPEDGFTITFDNGIVVEIESSSAQIQLTEGVTKQELLEAKAKAEVVHKRTLTLYDALLKLMETAEFEEGSGVQTIKAADIDKVKETAATLELSEPYATLIATRLIDGTRQKVGDYWVYTLTMKTDDGTFTLSANINGEITGSNSEDTRVLQVGTPVRLTASLTQDLDTCFRVLNEAALVGKPSITQAEDLEAYAEKMEQKQFPQPFKELIINHLAQIDVKPEAILFTFKNGATLEFQADGGFFFTNASTDEAPESRPHHLTHVYPIFDLATVGAYGTACLDPELDLLVGKSQLDAIEYVQDTSSLRLMYENGIVVDIPLDKTKIPQKKSDMIKARPTNPFGRCLLDLSALVDLPFTSKPETYTFGDDELLRGRIQTTVEQLDTDVERFFKTASIEEIVYARDEQTIKLHWYSTNTQRQLSFVTTITPKGISTEPILPSRKAEPVKGIGAAIEDMEAGNTAPTTQHLAVPVTEQDDKDSPTLPRKVTPIFNAKTQDYGPAGAGWNQANQTSIDDALAFLTHLEAVHQAGPNIGDIQDVLGEFSDYRTQLGSYLVDANAIFDILYLVYNMHYVHWRSYQRSELVDDINNLIREIKRQHAGIDSQAILSEIKRRLEIEDVEDRKHIQLATVAPKKALETMKAEVTQDPEYDLSPGNGTKQIEFVVTTNGGPDQLTSKPAAKPVETVTVPQDALTVENLETRLPRTHKELVALALEHRSEIQRVAQLFVESRNRLTTVTGASATRMAMSEVRTALLTEA